MCFSRVKKNIYFFVLVRFASLSSTFWSVCHGMAADPFAHIGDLLAQLAGSLKEIRGQGAEALASDVRLVGNTSSADVAIDPSTTVTMPVVGDTTPPVTRWAHPTR